MLQFLKKLLFYDLWLRHNVLMVPEGLTSMRSQSELSACERKNEEACLEGLKCLNKELLVALSNKLELF